MGDGCFCYGENVELFLTACRQQLNLPESDIFSAEDLTQFNSFQNVLRTLSVLSHTQNSIEKDLKPFPETTSPSSQAPCEDIYTNLGLHEVDKKLYDVAHYPFEEDSDHQIYNRIVLQPPAAVEDVWSTFKPTSERDHAIRELLETETNYVKKCLEMLMRDFYTPLKTCMATEDFKVAFGNIAAIYKVNQSFHENLRRAVLYTLKLERRHSQDGDLSIGSVFVKTKMCFLAYAEYCAHMKFARERLDEIERKEPMTKATIERLIQTSASGCQFRLQDLLLLPFQRICKYGLLLMKIIENTDMADPDRESLIEGLEAAKDVMDYVNETKRDYEHIEVSRSIERSIDKMRPTLDFTNFGRLQLDGPVRLSGTGIKTKERHVFFFEKKLLICKKLKNSQFVFKYAYKTADFKLQEPSISEPATLTKPGTLSHKITLTFGDTSFVLLRDTEIGVQELCLTLKSAQQRDMWRKKFRDALDKNSPAAGIRNGHVLQYKTYDAPTNCDRCHKLLLGKFFQGYYCQKCKRNFHYDCIDQVLGCKDPTPTRISDPSPVAGFIAAPRHSMTDEPFIAMRTVSSQDPQVLNFQEGERLFIYNDYGDGTFLGRRMNVPGVSGIVSRSDVIPESSLPSQGSAQNPEPLDETGKPITLASQYVVDEVVESTALEAQPWYFGPKGRQQANEMLMGKPDGTFIIRLSVCENTKILSVAFGGVGKHMKIEMTMEPTGIKYYLHDDRLFDSVFDLIAYYRKNTLAEGFDTINTVLTHTLLKTKTYRVLQDYKHPRVDAAKYLELRRNDIVEVIDTRGEEMGWWRFQDGTRSGFFPISYVECFGRKCRKSRQ
uniref:Guanine nucleotide exchange factor n=1 Tax=Panagrellus redivivus TaxID=6233 RepID=A0A7E4ZXQ4_PANRE